MSSMTRASTGSEAKRQLNGSGTITSVSNQRLVAASKRALEAHARVRRLAERLGEELEHITSPHGIPTMELDPEDSMVIAVEKVITTAKATTPPPISTAADEDVATSRTPTRLGVAPLRKPTGG
jgi:hypothetical protein